MHVWRIRLEDEDEEDLWSVLSHDERERARRFHFEVHRRGFVVAHAALRRILSGYLGEPAERLTFVTGEFGKPALESARGLEFNLSHSGDLALLAVSRSGDVGVDVERWNAEIDHLDLADHFFSQDERSALRELSHADDQVVRGFFAAWSRKEAYLKASGHGISRGLHHFDVSLRPGEPARLIADQLDDVAAARWVMRELVAAEGYSAALVAAAPVDEVLLFDAAGWRA
ncbi:MAG: 4'-phosphopantetheinyl transferase superfamily protein [Gemmatimonadaceae bacterium]